MTFLEKILIMSSFSLRRFPFVDNGIKDLLQELNTGHYANPIPKQRFDASVTHVLEQSLHRYIQTATPSFPRLRSTRAGSDSSADQATTSNQSVSPDPYDFNFPPLNHDFYSQNLTNFPTESSYNFFPTQNGTASNHQQSARSKSPDMVDMEISSPESNAGETSSRHATPTSRPASSQERRNGWTGWKDEVGAAKREKAPTPENNDDLQGALGLLMLATGGAADWGSYGDDTEEDGQESSVPAETVETIRLPSQPPSPEEVPSSPITADICVSGVLFLSHLTFGSIFIETKSQMKILEEGNERLIGLIR